MNHKISELDLDYPVLSILNNKGSLSTSSIKSLLKSYLKPSGHNLDPLMNRTDVKIDQIIRNIVSHRGESPNNIMTRRLVLYNNGYWSITEKGKKQLEIYKRHY